MKARRDSPRRRTARLCAALLAIALAGQGVARAEGEAGGGGGRSSSAALRRRRCETNETAQIHTNQQCKGQKM